MSRKPIVPSTVIEHSTAGGRVLADGPARLFATVAEACASVPKGSTVLVALSRRTSFIRTTRVPPLNESETRELLHLQAPSLFPTQGGELAVAHTRTHDRNAAGVLVSVTAAPVAGLTQLLEACKEHGLKVVSAVAVAHAATELARRNDHASAVVLQRSPEGLSIDIVHDGALRAARVVPNPANQQERDAEIARTCAIAEVRPSALLDLTASPDADLEVLRSTPASDWGDPLEPPAEAARRVAVQSANRARLAVLLWAACVTLGLLVFLDRSDDSKAARKEDAQAAAGLRKQRLVRDSVAADIAKQRSLSEQLERAFEPGQRLVDVLAVSGDLAPNNVWLTGSVLERGKPVLVRGTSTNSASVASYVESLGAQDRFRDVKLVFANSGDINQQPVVQFSVSMHAVGNLPLIDPKKKGARR